MATALLADRHTRRFSPLELRCLIEAGLFRSDEQPVLLDGAIVDGRTFEPRKFTTDDLDRMDVLGLFGDDDRLELIDGEIYLMARVNSPHAGAISRLNWLLPPALQGRAAVLIQVPIRLGPESEPQPDVALARFRADVYGVKHPTPDDLYLVIEVMDSSARHDRVVKLPIYAHAGIAEVWLVDLPGDGVEVYRQPEDGVYRTQQTLRRGQAVSPSAFPDVVLAVEAILSRVDS